MKLSDAILEGSKKHPQSHGKFAEIVCGEWRTCALGAALDGAGCTPMVDIQTLYLGQAVRDLKACGVEIPSEEDNIPYPPDPVEGLKGYSVAEIIVRLNDTHDWSRERIAEWLKTLDL